MRILVVESDSAVLDLVAEQLGEHGYAVVAVRGVEAAGFLRKPFTEQQLVDAVSGALPKPPAVESA
jgi:CheY-like chemotaxis protein